MDNLKENRCRCLLCLLSDSFEIFTIANHNFLLLIVHLRFFMWTMLICVSFRLLALHWA